MKLFFLRKESDPDDDLGCFKGLINCFLFHFYLALVLGLVILSSKLSI